MSDEPNEETQNEELAPAPDELQLLKSRAKMMGITFSNNIGIDALKEKIAAKMSAETKAADDAASDDDEPEEEAQVDDNAGDEAQAAPPTLDPVAATPAPKNADQLNPLVGDKAGETPARKLSKRERIIKEAMKLVRVRITCLDPKKKDLPGEILTVGNKYIGTVKKFIPYGEVTDDGYHIPKVLYDELESRRFLHIQTKRNRQNGQINVSTSYAKEFAIEVLPMLTPDELAKLASAQLAASNA